MTPRRSLSLPITLGIVMIVLLIVLIVGWVLLSLVSVSARPASAGLIWAFLAVGTTFLALVIVGVVLYLSLSIKAINLSRRQSNFIDSVTHELKSPIASLKLYLQTMNRRAVNDEQRESFQQFMLEDVERLDRLINHMLDAGRLDKRVADSEISTIALDSLLGECAQTICLQYRVDPDTIELNLAPAEVIGPRSDVEIIFRNLLDNAIKYAGTPPHVAVELRLEDETQAIVEIRDNGLGIPPSMRRKIFGRFERLGLELQREKPGTGLGLYIVRTLVRRLKGRVRVHDLENGTGSIFEVQLPAQPAGTGTVDTTNSHKSSEVT
jgi:signal transduction histidine kinase